MLLMVAMMLALFQAPTHAQGKERPVKYPTFYRTIQADGLSIFYREAGPIRKPRTAGAFAFRFNIMRTLETFKKALFIGKNTHNFT